MLRSHYQSQVLLASNFQPKPFRWFLNSYSTILSSCDETRRWLQIKIFLMSGLDYPERLRVICLHKVWEPDEKPFTRSTGSTIRSVVILTMALNWIQALNILKE